MTCTSKDKSCGGGEQMSFHLKSLYKIFLDWICLLASHLANLHLGIIAFQFRPRDWKGFFIWRQSWTLASQRRHLSLCKVNQGLGRNESRMKQRRRELALVWGLWANRMELSNAAGISAMVKGWEYKNDAFQSDGIFFWQRIKKTTTILCLILHPKRHVT